MCYRYRYRECVVGAGASVVSGVPGVTRLLLTLAALASLTVLCVQSAATDNGAAQPVTADNDTPLWMRPCGIAGMFVTLDYRKRF